MSPLLWSKLMEQLVGMFKNEKISSTVLALILLGAWWAYGWANDEFVKKGEFAKLQTTVSEGFENIEINDASQVIRDLKLKVMITKATGGPSSEVTRHEERLGHAESYKTCLVEQKPNCEHLKDVE